MWASQLLLEASTEASSSAVAMAGGLGLGTDSSSRSSPGPDVDLSVGQSVGTGDPSSTTSPSAATTPTAVTSPSPTVGPPSIVARHLDWVTPVCRVWSHVLRSASMSFKHVAFSVLSELLSSLRHHALGSGGGGTGGGNGTGEGGASRGSEHDTGSSLETINNGNFRHFTALLRQCVAMLPVTRLRLMGAKRLWYEMEDFPMYSRFLQVNGSCMQSHHITHITSHQFQ